MGLEKSDLSLSQSNRQIFPLGRNQRHFLLTGDKGPANSKKAITEDIEAKMDDVAPRIQDLIDDLILLEYCEEVEYSEEVWNSLVGVNLRDQWISADIPKAATVHEGIRDEDGHEQIYFGILIGRLTRALHSTAPEQRDENLLTGILMGLSSYSNQGLDLGDQYFETLDEALTESEANEHRQTDGEPEPRMWDDVSREAHDIKDELYNIDSLTDPDTAPRRGDKKVYYSRRLDVCETVPALCEENAIAPYGSTSYAEKAVERLDDAEKEALPHGPLMKYGFADFFDRDRDISDIDPDTHPFAVYRRLRHRHLDGIYRRVDRLEIKRWQGTRATDVFEELWLAQTRLQAGSVAKRLPSDNKHQVTRILKDLAGIDDANTDASKWKNSPLVSQHPDGYATTDYGDLIGMCTFHVYDVTAWLLSRLLGRDESYRTIHSPLENEKKFFEKSGAPDSAFELIVQALGTD